ncbi:hypothetical protein [Streptosporangium saharense]|uniref:hypothetical protein n=1 Tax=Streptosporangium saharense TaxID=1706840 RepID=UPI00331E0736
MEDTPSSPDAGTSKSNPFTAGSRGEFESASFDVIASVATLHHRGAVGGLARMRDLPRHSVVWRKPLD